MFSYCFAVCVYSYIHAHTALYVPRYIIYIAVLTVCVSVRHLPLLQPQSFASHNDTQMLDHDQMCQSS